MKKSLTVSRTIKSTYRTVWYSLGEILLFGVLFRLFAFAIARPVLRIILWLFMRLKGYPVLINADIANFFKSMTGVAVGIAVAGGAAFVIYYEFTALLILLKTGRDDDPQGVMFCLEKAAFSLHPFASWQSIGFVVFSLVLLPLLDTGLDSSLLPEINIPEFVLGEIEKYPGGSILLLTLILLLGYLFLRLFFTLPIMVFEEKKFFAAGQKSFYLTRHHQFSIFGIAFLAVLTGGLLFLLPTVILLSFRGLLALPFTVLSFLVLTIGAGLVPAIVMCASLVAYEQLVPPFLVEEEDLRVKTLDSKLRTLAKTVVGWFRTGWRWLRNKARELAPQWLSRRPYLALVLLVVPLVILVDFFIPLSVEPQQMQVIGHRGSLDGVENTIGAIAGAIEQGAQMAEIDVLLSKDNVPMVIHDSNLRRLSGKNVQLSDLTAQELEKITLSDRGYQGEISTLEEVCQFTKGKIKLLIEFKSHGQEQGSIVDETVRVIRKQGMTGEVLYQTIERPLLQEMRAKYPQYPMGYIVYGHVGRLSTRQILRIDADFLGVEQTWVSKRVVKAAHRAGKPIFVWTVNQADTVPQLAEYGVDGIITDYPEVMTHALSQWEEEEGGQSSSVARAPAVVKFLQSSKLYFH